MTMIPAAKPASPPRASSVPAATHPASPHARVDPQDLRAMRDALARARHDPVGETKEPPAPLAQAAPPPALAQTPRPAPPQSAPFSGIRQPAAAKDDQAQAGAPAAPLPQAPAVAQITVPKAPAPQVDPTAFATLIGQIWAREQAKGSREVQVRFGDRAWPATGLRLVRAADGSLDIALLAGRADPALGRGMDVLRDQLGRRGVPVGVLALEEDG